MKIIQVTRTTDTDTFEPIAIITMELGAKAVQEHLAISDEAVERFIGRMYLTAMHEWLQEQQRVEVENLDEAETEVTKEQHDEILQES